MKLKLDANGNVVLQDGKPVFIKDDGTEVVADVPGLFASVARLNAESKTHRERAEGAEGKLKAFEGITDAEAAKKALEVVANLDAKKLVDAGHVEKVKEEIKKGYEDRLTESDKKFKDLEAKWTNERIGGAFAGSKFISEKVAIPADILRANFGGSFKVEDGKIVAYASDGNKVMSRNNPGEVADFDEAISMIIEKYPHKDAILKASQKPGGNSQQPGGQGGSGKAISRSEFAQKTPAEQMAHMKGGGTVTD